MPLAAEPCLIPPAMWCVAFTPSVCTAILGSAVGYSVAGKDVCKAFVVHVSRFTVVTRYTWLAVYVLEQLRIPRRDRVSPPLPNSEVPGC